MSKCAVLLFFQVASLGKFFERVYELVDELQAFLPQKYNDLADCLAENAFLLKVLTYVISSLN